MTLVHFFQRKNILIHNLGSHAYRGNSIPFTHGVIVAQLKIVNGKEMIFFRDPYYPSNPSKPEKIFMLSYKTFVKRFTDIQRFRFAEHGCSEDATFGMSSCFPDRLSLT